VKITYSNIREFRNRPAPTIVVTVDLLTTGVDIPDLEGIVFLRAVKSRILFEQMLGRPLRSATAMIFVPLPRFVFPTFDPLFSLERSCRR